MIDVVILAGGDSKGLAADAFLPKSLLLFKDKLMLDYILEALSSCKEIRKKVLVGPLLVKEKRGDKVDNFIEGGKNVFENLLLGLNALSNSSHVLVVTSDIPLLSAEALDDFLQRCREKEAQFYYPVVRKEDSEKKYPGNKRTYVKVREGTFTGGNIFLLDPIAIKRSAHLAEKMISLRKKPLHLASALGWSFLLKFVLGILTIEELEKRVSTLFQLKAVSIITPYPEIGVDIDKPSDLRLVQYLNQGG